MRRAILATVIPAVSIALVAELACGAVDDPPASPIPINVCPAFPCAGYKHTTPAPLCNGGVCISSGQLDPILVIDIPESSFFAPSQSIAISYSDLVHDRYQARSGLSVGCLPPGCAVLPSLTQSSGAYIASAALQASVQRDLRSNAAGGAGTVPAHVTFRPLWPPEDAPPYVEATLAGIPLLPMNGRAGASTTLGPGGTPGIGWIATLLPGAYERTITPDPPFDDAFPPRIDVLVIDRDTTDFTLLADVDAKDQLETTRGLRVTREGPDTSLEGWTVYLRDLVTQRRISEIVTLHGTGGATTFRLNTVGYPGPLSGTQPVIAPPSVSDGVPTFVDNVILDSLAADPPVDHPRIYPALPPTAFVSGAVQGPQNTTYEADLFIQEATNAAGGGLLLTSDPTDPAQPFLHYKTHVATTGGYYSAFLPPGNFDVIIVPASDSGLSVTQTKLDVSASGPRVQAGKNLQALPKTKVTGSCIVDDDRPLAGAEVEASPAIELVGVVDPSRWPRPVRAQTADDGTFELLLDQGAYDIIVRPALGSDLPWTVSSSHHIGAKAIQLEPLRVLAPVGFDLTLHAPDDFSPIVRAVVRAYAFAPRGAAGVEGGAGGASGSSGSGAAVSPAAIEIGRWITGFDGRFRMFVSAPQ